MITPALVKANVIDIRRVALVFPSDMVVDANVLYWLFYSNFPSLHYAGGRMPLTSQRTDYAGYWHRAVKAKTQFHVLAATLGEFAKTAEYAELETIWLTDTLPPQPDPANPVSQFDPRVCKFARYHYSGLLTGVRKTVETMLASIRKSVLLLPLFPTPDDQHNRSVVEWGPSCGDFSDAAMVAAAKEQSKTHILSDDTDVATFPEITLSTANGKTISNAAVAGKLL